MKAKLEPMRRAMQAAAEGKPLPEIPVEPVKDVETLKAEQVFQ